MSIIISIVNLERHVSEHNQVNTLFLNKGCFGLTIWEQYDSRNNINRDKYAIHEYTENLTSSVNGPTSFKASRSRRTSFKASLSC